MVAAFLLDSFLEGQYVFVLGGGMGYRMEQGQTEFCIKKYNFRPLVVWLQLWIEEKISENLCPSWVSSYNLEAAFWEEGACNQLAAIMGAWRWEAYFSSKTGDIEDVYFQGEKAGDDLMFFEKVAPFVEEGSYITMHGEDHCMWRWHFDGAGCFEIYPTIAWPI